MKQTPGPSCPVLTCFRRALGSSFAVYFVMADAIALSSWADEAISARPPFAPCYLLALVRARFRALPSEDRVHGHDSVLYKSRCVYIYSCEGVIKRIYLA